MEKIKEVIQGMKELPKCSCGGTLVPIINQEVIDPGCHCHHSNTVITSLIWKCTSCEKILK